MGGENRAYESWSSISDLFYQHVPSSQGPWLPPRAILGETEASGGGINSSIPSSSNTTSMVASTMPQWQPGRASCLPVTSWLVPGSFPIWCHHPTDKRGLTPTSKVGSSPVFQLALELLSINYQFAPTTYKMLSGTFVPRQKKKSTCLIPSLSLSCSGIQEARFYSLPFHHLTPQLSPIQFPPHC